MPPLSWQGCISSLGPLGAAESRRMSEYINSHQDMGPLRCEWQPAAVDTVPNPTATHLSPATHYAQTRACVRACVRRREEPLWNQKGHVKNFI